MARQEFFNGGFIGKVGDVIGQRWHEKRYVRTYTKPTNPKSDKQQHVRAVFRNAIKLAQQAMNVNGHDGKWDTTKISEFQARTSQALKKLHAGATLEDALPLYPDSYAPAYMFRPESAYWDDDFNLNIEMHSVTGSFLPGWKFDVNIFNMDTWSEEELVLGDDVLGSDDVIYIPNIGAYYPCSSIRIFGEGPIMIKGQKVTAMLLPTIIYPHYRNQPYEFRGCKVDRMYNDSAIVLSFSSAVTPSKYSASSFFKIRYRNLDNDLIKIYDYKFSDRGSSTWVNVFLPGKIDKSFGIYIAGYGASSSSWTRTYWAYGWQYFQLDNL
jgi:hypothetical protein